LETLNFYRESRPNIYKEYLGLFSSQGKEWHDMRTIANPIMMQPKTAKLYCSQVDEIAKEFVEL
jgi:cytochrome P450 family 12